MFGDLVKAALQSIKELDSREKWVFAPLVAMTLLLGVYPSLVTDVTGPTVQELVDKVEASVSADVRLAMK